MPLAVNLKQRQHIAGVLASQNVMLVKLVSYRRGIVTVQARGSSRLLACKMALPGIFEHDENELKIEINTVRLVATELYVQDGCYNCLPWLSLHWQPGKTLSMVAEACDKGLISKADFIKIIINVCARFEALHAIGWVHGDVQPRHILIEKDQTVLVDWGLAHRLDDNEFPYQGAMVHFEAPEVARSLSEY